MKIDEYRNKNGDQGHQKSSEELERDIAVTRARMDRTVDELADKLDPRESVASAYEWAKDRLASTDFDTVRKVGNQTVAVAKENPMPFILGALAVASSLMPRPAFFDREPGYKYQSRRPVDLTNNGSSRLDHLSESAGEVKEHVASSVGSTIDSVKSGTANLRDKTNEFTHDTARRLEQGKEEFPISMAFGALALGAAFAMCLPRSRRENRLVGETSDNLMAKAREQGSELASQAREKLAEKGVSVEHAKEKIHETIESTADKAAEKLDDIEEQKLM